ncbi:hypothetical protein Fot_14131 [Forsythia ovata]|uniref:Thioredoxin domain-containing protein n=1 Tax=Forsythia ovata TaxID=205694 RepID=A0ABD1W7S4_9LAMI
MKVTLEVSSVNQITKKLVMLSENDDSQNQSAIGTDPEIMAAFRFKHIPTFNLVEDQGESSVVAQPPSHEVQDARKKVAEGTDETLVQKRKAPEVREELLKDA